MFNRIKSAILYLNYLLIVCLCSLVLVELVLSLTREHSVYYNFLHNFNTDVGVPFDYDPVKGWRNRKNSPSFIKCGQNPLLTKSELCSYKEGVIRTDLDGFFPNHEEGCFEPNNWDDKTVKRIFMLGGSTMKGQGVSDYTQTISSHLETFLNDNSRKVRFINAGVGGYHLGQEKMYAFDELIHRNPDGFIFYDGWNNIWASKAKQTLDTYEMTPYHETLVKGINTIWHADMLTTIAVHAKFILKDTFPHLIRKIIRLKQTFFRQNYKQASSQEVSIKNYTVLQGYLKNGYINFKFDLLQSALLCKGLELSCVFVLQPLIYTGKKQLTKLEKEKIYDVEFEEELSRDIRTVYPHYEKLYKSLDKRFSEDKNIRFLVLSTVFDKEKRRVYLDTGHLLDIGNKIVAKEI